MRAGRPSVGYCIIKKMIEIVILQVAVDSFLTSMRIKFSDDINIDTWPVESIRRLLRYVILRPLIESFFFVRIKVDANGKVTAAHSAELHTFVKICH